jgi:hypothetical protein
MGLGSGVKKAPDPRSRIRIRTTPRQSGKLNPDPHHSETVEALEGHFWSIGWSKSGKSEW